MKILYGTGNPSKFTHMHDYLKTIGIDIVGLRDMEGEIPSAPEDGKTVLENARQKAHIYYEHYKMPVFSCDSGLLLEGLPDELQPGIHVRTVNGRYLTDDEMIEYYGGLARRFGDITARYMNGICFIADKEHIYESADERLWGERFIITSTPHRIRKAGFPLDSLSLEPKSGKYYYDISDEAANSLVEYEYFGKLLSEWLQGFDSHF